MACAESSEASALDTVVLYSIVARNAAARRAARRKRSAPLLYLSTMPHKAHDDTRVVKRIAPHEPGALKLTRRYGSALVCVRYRHDATGQHRYTTVELIVDDAPIIPRGQPDDMVGVRIDPDQPTQRSRAYARGATWDRKSNLWLMPRRLARTLRLTHCIVKVLP